MLVREERLMLPGPVGQLEAMYLNTEQPKGLALLCHPNPEHGGTMLNKVVSTMQRTARDMGLITLRFNYRGTGNSAGEHDMKTGEVDDAEAALAWLMQKHPDLPVYLFGFSFGGYVVASLSLRLEQQGIQVAHQCLVAPAVGRLQTANAIAQGGALTVIQPEEDEVIAAADVYAWAEALSRNCELFKVAESGHFFHGKLVELKEILVQQLATTIRI